LTLEELEEQRTANEKRLKELEQIYMNKRQNSGVGRIIRENMGYTDNSRKSLNTSPRNHEGTDGEESERIKYGSPSKISEGYFGSSKNNNKSKSKKKKSVRIASDRSEEGEKDEYDSKYNFKSDNLRSDEDNIFSSNNLLSNNDQPAGKGMGSSFGR
jgi:hypothetical protein